MKFYSVKWYMRGLFPHPLTEIVLAIVLASQYYAERYAGGQLAFVTVSQLLLLPIYGLLMSFHVIRDSKLTVFELSVLKSWEGIAIAKIIVLVVGFVPILVADIVLISSFSGYMLSLFLVAWVLEYLTITCLASLVRSQSGALLIVISFGILIPVGILSVLSYASSTHLVLGTSLSIVMYVLAPMLTYYYSSQGMLTVMPWAGFSSILAISLILLGGYFWIFLHSDLDL